MAIVSAGYAGSVNDSQWALMSRFFGQDFGILNLGELNCTNPAGTKNFNLSAGTLYGRGIMDVSDAVVNVAPTVPVSGGQWFLIVARRVWATKTTSFIALPGPTTTTATPTSRPAAYPAMQRNPGVQDDQPLWWVWVNASNTTTVRFDQRIFSNGRVADFGAIPPTGFLTRGSQLTVESVRMTIVDDGTAWKPITMRVSGTTAQRNEATAAGMVAEGMEWRDTTDNSDYVRGAASWGLASGTKITAKQSSGSQTFSAETALAGLAISLTLEEAREVHLGLTFRRYSSTADVLINYTVKNNGVVIWDATTQGNSGGANSGLTTTHKTSMVLPSGTNNLVAYAKRVVGTGQTTVNPVAIDPNVLFVELA